MTSKRRHRPASLDYAVFAVAAFLALFLVYEVAKRRVKPQTAPQDAAQPFIPPPGFAAPPPEVRAPDMPPERGGRGPMPEIAVDRVVKRRPAVAVPQPPR
jgi:hypothetical protein